MNPDPEYFAIKAMWQGWHQEQKQTALTGTRLDGYARHTGLPPSLLPGATVLEVGVGLAHATRDMRLAGARVWAVDICERALESATKAGAWRVTLAEDAERMPAGEADLAVCHLVTQHMADAHILALFPFVIRALKPGGTFFCQWAGSHVEGENDIADTIVGVEGQVGVQNTPSMAGGRMVRSPEGAKRLLELCGARVTKVGHCRSEYPEYSSYWFSSESIRV